LTKRFEEVVRGTAQELARRFPEPPKGEITLVVGGAPAVAAAADEGEAVDAVLELLGAGVPRRQAVDVVARLARISRNALYSQSLKSR
jgi:16S rRNA (cytidine1402-2'-O)-methyltransferase